ncbi:MAG TPA: hypothetical protein VFV39_01865 [Limnobacter sp.]|nr:hypothetical protein [Limnobacter sp.]
MAGSFAVAPQVSVVDADPATADTFTITVPREYADVAGKIEFTGDPLLDGAMWASLRGLGAILLQGLNGSTPAVPPPPVAVQDFARAFFGLSANAPITREQMAVLSSLGLIAQDASSMSWSLTPRGIECATMAGVPNSMRFRSFIPSVNMFLVKNEDLDSASVECPAMFTATGYATKPGTNPPSNYGSADVERIARSLFTKIQGPVNFDLTQVQETSVDDKAKIAKLVADLLGLPPGTSWEALTAEQVNAAIACGLIVHDPSTKKLVITVNGATYMRSKIAADAPPPGGVPPAVPNGTKAVWDAWKLFYEGGGIIYADYVEWHKDSKGAVKDNSRFGGMGIELLAYETSWDSEVWAKCGLGHLNKDQREALIRAAQTIASSPYSMQYEVSSFGEDSRASDFDRRTFTPQNIKGWLEANAANWYGTSLDQVKIYYNDPNFTVDIVYDPQAFLATPDTEQKLNEVCERLFGEKFADMSPDERRKALHLLTHTYPIFYYTPPEYADVFDPATGTTTRAVVKPGQLYLRPDAMLPGTTTIGDPAKRGAIPRTGRDNVGGLVGDIPRR